MSRQNKVNPGQYTSAGRLSPDDLGRELRRQNGKATPARVPKTERPAWETTQPALTISPTAAASAKTPGRAKVAAAHAVIGVTRVTARAVKTVTGAAKRVVAKGAGSAATTTRAAAAAAPRAGKTTALVTKTAKTPVGPAAKRR